MGFVLLLLFLLFSSLLIFNLFLLDPSIIRCRLFLLLILLFTFRLCSFIYHWLWDLFLILIIWIRGLLLRLWLGFRFVHYLFDIRRGWFILNRFNLWLILLLLLLFLWLCFCWIHFFICCAKKENIFDKRDFFRVWYFFIFEATIKII